MGLFRVYALIQIIYSLLAYILLFKMELILVDVGSKVTIRNTRLLLDRIWDSISLSDGFVLIS